MAAAVLALLRLLADRWPRRDRLHSRGGSLRPLFWSALLLVPVLALVSPAIGRLTALTYVLHDLRWFWWLSIFAAVLQPFDIARPFSAARDTDAGPRSPGVWTAPDGVRLVWYWASLALIPICLAIAFTPQLRFSGALHGDEPKYVRYAENLFQGRGFDFSQKERLSERRDDRPRLLNNVWLAIRAAPEEAGLLLADARRALGLSASPPMISGRVDTSSLFFEGKHPGTVYQIHNPGLSWLLLPGYYLDRRVTGSGVGYQGEFPSEMPALHWTLLALYAAYSLGLCALLRSCGARPWPAWLLALLGVLMLPTSAFAFQIYPEVAAGLAIVLTVRRLLATDRSASGLHAFLYGGLASFLPWLHVRFALVTVIAMVWTATDSTQARRTRGWFAAGSLGGVLALSLYTYHLTGSLIPVATYGSQLPLSLDRLAHGLPALAFDRVWGLFPHAPLYLMALPGFVLAWRRRPALVWLIGLTVAAVGIPAASHAFWAAGTTPGRLLVPVAPLLLVFVAETVERWSARRMFSAAFVTLTVLSLDASFRYNFYHVKERGPLLAKGFSGWRPNLLFPSTGTDVWTATSADLVLLAAWLAAALLLILLPLWMTSRAPDRRPSVPRVDLAAAAAALVCVAMLGEVAARVSGHRLDALYLMPPHEARERALARFAADPKCAFCYVSSAGFVSPTDALGNDLELVDVRLDREALQAAEPFLLRVRPRSKAGEYIVSSVRVEFGDGSTASRPRAFADVEFEHQYPTPGHYEVGVYVRTPAGEQLVVQKSVTVQPPR